MCSSPAVNSGRDLLIFGCVKCLLLTVILFIIRIFDSSNNNSNNSSCRGYLIYEKILAAG